MAGAAGAFSGGESLKSERLRMQLSSVGERFIGFKTSIADDTRRRRMMEEQRFQVGDDTPLPSQSVDSLVYPGDQHLPSGETHGSFLLEVTTPQAERFVLFHSRRVTGSEGKHRAFGEGDEQ